MSKLQALTALRDKVKAGDSTRDGSMFRVFGYSWTHCFDAYNGSLDAAKALHEAVLPGWEWGLNRDGATIWIENPDIGPFTGDNTPARAWLLAILDALIAQEGNTSE